MPKDFISSAGLSSAKEPRLVPQKKLSALLSAITEWLTLAAVVLVPLIFLVNTSQSLEFPKQIVMLMLVSVAALCWIGTMLVDKTLSIRRTVANPVVLFLLGAVLISSLLSKSHSTSIIGDGGQEYASLVTTILFAALYFVVTNIQMRRHFAPLAIFATTVTGGLVSLYAVFQFAGVHLLPFVTASSFNLIGSTVTLGLYAAVIAVLSATSFLAEEEGRFALAKRIAVGVSGALALFVVAIINFWPVWTALALGLVAVLVFAIVRPHAIKRLNWLAVPMIGLVITVLFIAVNISLPIHAPAEVFPSLSQSFTVARDSLFGNPIFGSGPGTFNQDFALHRSLELNKSSLWYVQFDRGASYLTTAAATLGLAGLVAWLAVLIIGLWKPVAYLAFSKSKGDGSWLFSMSVFAAWVASAAGLVLYGTSIAALFLFWMLFAILIRTTASESAEVGFETSPRSGLVLTFSFVLIIVLALAGWFVSATRLYADVAFASGISKSTDTNLTGVIADLEKAVNMNPQSDSIVRNLSQAYLLKIQQIMNDPKLSATDRGNQVQALTTAAIRAGSAATDLAPQNLQNWVQLGAIYEAIMPYVTNAGDEAIKAYNKAADLDPTSPVHATAIGRVYLAEAGLAQAGLASAKDAAAKADIQKAVDDGLNSALTSIGKSLDLKADYAPGIYQKALVLDAQGKAKDAVAALEPVFSSNPNDGGVAIEMAILYYHNDQKDKAQAVLEYVVSKAPDFVSARSLLSSVYEGEQKWDDAIAQIQALIKLAPDNKDLQTRLQTLQDEKSGKVAPAATAPSADASTAPEAPTSPTSLPSKTKK
jgi:tetratricopeptide (TPR) repeat protein